MISMKLIVKQREMVGSFAVTLYFFFLLLSVPFFVPIFCHLFLLHSVKQERNEISLDDEK